MPNIGDPAPQFSAVDVINNKTYNLADYSGQVVLLIFSGPSWCPPCKFEAPVLQDLWEVFGVSFAQPRVQFLMVSVGDTPQAFKNAVQNFGITFPALLNPKGTDLSTLYGTNVVPTLFVINTEQKICDIHFGAAPPAAALYEEIYKLLIGCGAAEPKPLVMDLWPWPLLRIPIPDPDPWRPLLRLSPDERDVFAQLAIAKLARRLRDFKTSSTLEAAALKGAEASMRKLVAKNALQPKELDKAFSNKPKR